EQRATFQEFDELGLGVELEVALGLGLEARLRATTGLLLRHRCHSRLRIQRGRNIYGRDLKRTTRSLVAREAKTHAPPPHARMTRPWRPSPQRTPTPLPARRATARRSAPSRRASASRRSTRAPPPARGSLRRTLCSASRPWYGQPGAIDTRFPGHSLPVLPI